MIEDIHARALHHFGYEQQELMMIEEMAELAQSICKRRRGEGIENLLEEMVDVSIVLDQMFLFYGQFDLNEKIGRIRDSKLKRLEERMRSVAPREF